MRQTNKTKKSGVLRKLFAKISRLMGYELIDQSNLSFVNSSDEISNEICAKINEVLGVDGGNGNPTTLGSTAGFTHQYDLSALTLDPSTNPTSVSTADVDAVAAVLPAGSTFLNGGVEGICIEDTGSAQNTFVFYVQEF